MTSQEALRREIAQIQEIHRRKPERMRGMYVPYTRRGEMSIPGFRMQGGGDPEKEGRQQSLRVMKKAAHLPVDFFFYDLEDAAPDQPSYKTLAREFVIEALQTTDFGERIVAFRPNNIRTPYFEDDLIDVISKAGERLHALVIPKTEYAEEVEDILRIVRRLQALHHQTRPLVLEILIESPRALLEAEKIAALDGVVSLVFGAWDFARTTGASITAQTWLSDQTVVRQWLPIVAAAYGKDAVDSISVELPLRPKKPDDLSEEQYQAALRRSAWELHEEDFGSPFVQAMKQREYANALSRRDAENARALGYAAKWILHPEQIEPIQSVWTPTRDAALRALALIARYTEAARRGSGAEVDRTRLADKAVVASEWWQIPAALRARSLTTSDIEATGFRLEDLQRTVVSHDSHAALVTERPK